MGTKYPWYQILHESRASTAGYQADPLAQRLAQGPTGYQADPLAQRLAQGLGEAVRRMPVSVAPTPRISWDPLDEDGTKTAAKNAASSSYVVPRDRIELPTRGFSSTSQESGSGRKDKWLRVLKGGV